MKRVWLFSVLLAACFFASEALVRVMQGAEPVRSADSVPPAARSVDEVRIDCDFPGGNIVVDRIENGVVRLRQDLRDTAGWWFYWYFRVQGADGKKLKFEFTNGKPVGVRGPAVSVDEGKTWRWLGAASGDTGSFTYSFPLDAGPVRFAYTIPYLQSDWERFVEPLKANRGLQVDELCKSRHGRTVPCAYFGCPDGEPAAHVLLTCRHHACESMASFAVEGLIRAVLSPTADETRWLASHVRFLAVPFVDCDGVQEGDQGKNRKPRDHGRDYQGEPLYPETAAIRKLFPKWSVDRPAVTLDLHCPWIRGKHNEDIYIVGSSVDRIWKEQQRLGAILEKACKGPLPYRAADNLPFGVAWNTARNYQAGKSIGRWAAERPEVHLAASFEVPYANAGGVEVNPDSARAFGRDLAVALGRYLRGAEPGN